MTAATRMSVVLVASLALATSVWVAVAVAPRGARGQPATPAQVVFRVPRDTTPSHLALAGDGSVWATADLGGVIRLSPTGATRILLGTDLIPDVTRGPDGAIYAVGERIVRIDAVGRIRRYRVRGDPEAITAGAGAVWVTGSDDPPRISRVSPDGRVSSFLDRAPGHLAMAEAIATAADGSVWFTQAVDLHGSVWRGGIGRMRPDGSFSNWRLPLADGQPGRITAGSDGAMWFVERRAIGRISDDGSITRHPLPNGLRPTDIAAGGDGALWFTSNVCLGRMATSGQVTTWRIPGAVQLGGVAVAPDGTFWLADGADAIRHVDPAAMTPGPCGAPELVRRKRPTTATVAYSVDDGFNHRPAGFTDLHLAIARHGRALFSEDVPGGRQGSPAVADERSLMVRDLDGDGEPEVALLLNDGGAHCCSWSRVYRFLPHRRTYAPVDHRWGEASAQPRLRDVDHDGRPEFTSRDGRFYEGPGSPMPIQIWSYRRGEFKDVTGRFPRLIRRDAASVWRYYRSDAAAARGILPAWVADECRLGRAEFAFRVLERERLRGALERTGGGYWPGTSRQYIRALKRRLRRWGYGC